MMIDPTRHIDLSYYSFLDELEHLLQNSGITPSRQQIQAEANPEKNWHKPPEEHSPQIGRVIVYMEEHLAEPLNLEELAKEAQLSKYQLIRRFRAEQGTTPWKYLISERVDKAKKLLEKGWSPGQVAVETGFYDQPHFSKSFRDKTGQTPKEYQEQNFENRN